MFHKKKRIKGFDNRKNLLGYKEEFEKESPQEKLSFLYLKKN